MRFCTEIALVVVARKYRTTKQVFIHIRIYIYMCTYLDNNIDYYIKNEYTLKIFCNCTSSCVCVIRYLQV